MLVLYWLISFALRAILLVVVGLAPFEEVQVEVYGNDVEFPMADGSRGVFASELLLAPGRSPWCRSLGLL